VAGKISVIGDVPVAATLGAGARGADVIVAGAREDVVAALRLAPAAVVLLVDASADDVARALEATLVPRQRVVGVARDDVERAATAVAGGAPIELRATLRDGPAEVTLGRGGIVAIG
jgi:hypothetical protein